jgi:putative peptide zinc metalloprotease protein
MRRISALVIAFTLSLALPAAAGGPNHIVTASPTAEGSQIHRSSVVVAPTGADSVTSTNLARATPHDCTGCEGIAVAFQAVIATGSPTDVSPTNAAVAANSSCMSCKAFAYAYQYVLTADAGAHLGSAGAEKVADIRARAAALVDDGLPYDELDARLDALAAEFKAAVLDDLESAGAHPRAGERDADADAAPAG